MGPEIIEQVSLMAEQISKLEAKHDILQEQLEKVEQQHQHWSSRLSNATRARKYIQLAAQTTQRNVEGIVSTIVSMAVQSIPFADSYSFVLEFVQKRGKTEAEIWLDKDGERCKPMESVGGGLCDIISFGMLTAFKQLKPSRKLLIVDEPFRNLSADLQPHASMMLKTLSNELSMQIVTVSHIKEMAKAADQIIHIKDEE